MCKYLPNRVLKKSQLLWFEIKKAVDLGMRRTCGQKVKVLKIRIPSSEPCFRTWLQGVYRCCFWGRCCHCQLPSSLLAIISERGKGRAVHLCESSVQMFE